MKCLVVICGEAFRDGGQCSRLRDTERSIETQKTATDSHIRLLGQLKTAGYDPHVIITTYNTKYQNELAKSYEPYLIRYNCFNELIGMNNLINFSTQNIDVLQYEFVFFIRPDIAFKEEFYQVFNPLWSRVMFASVCFKSYDNIHTWHRYDHEPRLNDIMIFVPKNYFGILGKIYLGHESWIYFKTQHNMTNNDMDLMLDTFHDSDTEKDFNPIYYLVSRPQCDIWHTPGEKIDRSLFSTPAYI